MIKWDIWYLCGAISFKFGNEQKLDAALERWNLDQMKSNVNFFTSFYLCFLFLYFDRWPYFLLSWYHMDSNLEASPSPLILYGSLKLTKIAELKGRAYF